jgi:hypothetical protein
MKMDLRKTDYDDGRWMELADDCLKWRTVILSSGPATTKLVY